MRRMLCLYLLVSFLTGCGRAREDDAGASEDGSGAAAVSPQGKVPAVLIAAALLPAGGDHAVTAPAAKPMAPGLSEYLEGIEMLESARWIDAAGAFGKATDADGDNPAYHTARGVACTLAEKFSDALAELQRAQRLRVTDWESKLWLAVAYRMSGDPAKGAQLFSHGEASSKDYADLVYNEMGMEYWSSRYNGQYYDKTTRQTVQANGPVRRKFAEAGAWFARRAKSVTAGQDMTTTLFARAVKRYGDGQYAAALADLEQVRVNRPEDLDLLYYHAGCKLALGDAITARTEYTRLLTARTHLTAAYLGRAAAAGRMGDVGRAHADLATAAKLSPQETARIQSAVQKSLDQAARDPEPGDPVDRLAALEEAAKAGAPWKTLVERSLAVQQAAMPRQRHYDEAYQDRLKALEDAARDDANTPDRWADLGKFLYEGSEVFGETVAPREPPQRFRHQTPLMQKQELARAEAMLDQALKLKPDHLSALVTKAALCFDQARYDDAETLLKHAMEVGPDDAELMWLFGELRKYGAQWRALRAGALRTPDTWTTENREGDYIVTRYYTRNPSQADLRLAEEYQRESDELAKLARQHIERAIRLSRGTARGSYYEGLVQKWSRNLEGARQSFEEAVKRDSRFIRAHQELIYVLDRLGREDDRLREESVLINLVQTSAAPLLKLAWKKVTTTAWTGAREALAGASGLDPADARAPAFRGVMAEAQGKPDEAVRDFQIALALEEARANLQGTTLRPGGSGGCNPAEIGLTMTVRNRLGQVLLQRGQADKALDSYRANVALEARLSRRDWTAEVYSAMLPDPSGHATAVPAADNVAALLAWSRLGMGNALLALKRPQEAEQEFRAVRAYEPAFLATERGRERLREPDAWAVFALCRASLARRDAEGAWRLFLSWGRPWGLSARAEEERKKVQAEIDRARRQGF